MTDLERKIIEAARRWYQHDIEAPLAEAVMEYEQELRDKRRAQAELPL